MSTIDLKWVPMSDEVLVESAEQLVKELEKEGRNRYSQLATKDSRASKYSGISELLKYANTKCWVLLADLDRLPVGIAICQTAISSWDLAEVLNIHDLFVSTAYRGKGVGTELIKEIESKGRELQMSQVTLETNIGNLHARRLYQNLGYQGTLLTSEGQCPIQACLNDSLNLGVIRMKKRLTR